MKQKSKIYTKVALALSLVLLVIWGLMGTGASLAWFNDSSAVLRNSFIFGDFDLEVSYKKGADYEPVDATTAVFDANALYEPGYLQVVYLKVKNAGDLAFTYKLAVDVQSVHTATSVLGNEIYLPNYLKYGVIFGDSEAALTREVAKIQSASSFPDETADLPLNLYTEEDSVTVEPNKERYIAILVRMPEEVGNTANYRGANIPQVELGLTVTATQA